jgi:thioredoxin 1
MTQAQNPASINEKQLIDLLNRNSTAVVKVTATWSGSCQIAAPIYKELFREYHNAAGFFTIDMDSNPDVMKRYSVYELPHFLLFRNGELVDQVAGTSPKKLLEEKIKKLLTGKKIK